MQAMNTFGEMCFKDGRNACDKSLALKSLRALSLDVFSSTGKINILRVPLLKATLD